MGTVYIVRSSAEDGGGPGIEFPDGCGDRVPKPEIQFLGEIKKMAQATVLGFF